MPVYCRREHIRSPPPWKLLILSLKGGCQNVETWASRDPDAWHGVRSSEPCGRASVGASTQLDLWPGRRRNGRGSRRGVYVEPSRWRGWLLRTVGAPRHVAVGTDVVRPHRRYWLRTGLPAPLLLAFLCNGHNDWLLLRRSGQSTSGELLHRTTSTSAHLRVLDPSRGPPTVSHESRRRLSACLRALIRRRRPWR